MAAKIDPNEVLSKVRVAKPCTADWREMVGDDRIRHCSLCARNVYNISEMSREEAAALIQGAEGRLCIRYYARPDGTMMSGDCGKPMPTSAKRLGLLAGVTTLLGGFAAAILIQFAGPQLAQFHPSESTFVGRAVAKTLVFFHLQPPSSSPSYPAVMGDVMYIPPTKSP